MTRADLIDYARSMFDALGGEARVSLTDTPGGLAHQVDAVLTALGDAAGDTASDEAARALMEYHTLRKLRIAAAARTDTDATAAQRGLSQLFSQIDRLTADAAQRCAAAGYPVTAAQSFGITALNLGFLDTPAEGLLGPELFA